MLDEQQLSVINDALLMGPFGRVAPVVAAINQQLQEAQSLKAQELKAPEPAPTHVEGGWVPAVGGIHE